MGRHTAPRCSLHSRPRSALGTVAVTYRSFRITAAYGTARAETPLGADTSHGGCRRRGRRRHALAVRPDAALTPSPARQEFCAFGGKSLAHLADGSTVWLQSGSTLACDGSFGAESRNVKLRGEGFFDIAKDPERPFTVEVEGLRIRVHGTKFNVNTSLEDRTVAVSLVEGSVALDSGKGEQRQLYPGEIACYNTATQKLDICRGNVELESCWAAGKLVFERQSLGEICRYLSRWYDIRIDISPALARNYAYTFTITDEPLEAILRIMSRINPIVYTFSDNRSVSISEVE